MHRFKVGDTVIFDPGVNTATSRPRASTKWSVWCRARTTCRTTHIG